jgi:hypothetical protein
MIEKEYEFAISRRTLLKAAGITAVTGGVLTTPVTAEQPGNSEENRRDQENRPEGVGTSPQGVGTSPQGVGTSPMGFGTSPLADGNIE